MWPITQVSDLVLQMMLRPGQYEYQNFIKAFKKKTTQPVVKEKKKSSFQRHKEFKQ